MKAPLSWLKEYVDIDCSPEVLEEKLFSCGFEVEGMEYAYKNLNKVVTCKIISMEKHPNADKLSVTQVDAGEYGTLQIITAAKNVFVGAIVPVALDGATLFNGEHINAGNLRGLPSYGMFCGGEEIGINDEWYKGASTDGVLIFSEDLPLGKEVKDLLGLEDVIFDINVTANRPDCQSIFGIAREVAAVLGKPFRMPDLYYETDKEVSTVNTVKVFDNATDLCPRYISHLVKDVKLAESPLWLKRRLFRMGVRAINNFVDITNYVLLELGQPMHAFDLKDLENKTVNIRRAVNGEKITTLDEKVFELNDNNLVIADGKKPVALAGVMGGLSSEIKDSSENILLESAKFLRDNIRKTSRALGQKTDASARYEKGVDVFTVKLGMERALNLIYTLKIGKIACDEYDLCVEKTENKVLKTKISKINGVLGIDVSAETIERILNSLNFETAVNGDEITVKVPQYREDVESYQDIAEEIIREYGYEHITPTLLKTSAITSGGRNEAQKRIEDLKKLLVGYGFNEAITYSFVSEKDFSLFKIEDEKLLNPIKIINPIGEDMMIMRTTLLPSIVKAACSNIARKNFDGRLFELAKTYFAKNEKDALADEKTVLSIAMFGENEDFYTIKGVFEGIFDYLCNGVDIKYVKSHNKGMHPTRCADVYVNGVKIGYFGQINPLILDKLNSDKPVYAGEIYYDELDKLFNDKIVFKPVSKFPKIERDLAVTVDADLPYDKVYDCIKGAAGEYLTELKLFDIYQGEQVGKGKKSMAFNLVFVSVDRTLNVEEIDAAIKNILTELKEKTGAELR